MTAADKKKLDDLAHAESISSLVFKNDSSKTYMGVKFSANRVSARFLIMENNGRRADIQVSYRIGIDTKAIVYACWNTDTEFRIFYDNEDYIYVVFNCSAWSRGSCISTIENAIMTEWNGTSYPSNLTAITTDIRYTLDSANFTRYALAKDGTAVAATKMSTARKINTIAFDGTEDITIPRSRSLVHQATGTNGSTGYVAVATLTVKATFCNLPGFIRYRNRGRAIVDLTFRFKNANTNDPELDFARMDFDVNAAERAYLAKSGTGTWVLYISKAEKYDGIEIMDCQPPTGIDIEFTNAHASSLPSGTVAFTQHNRANESSTVAAAKTLTDSGWIIPTFPSDIKNSTIRYRKQGKIVSVSGYVIFSEATSAKVVLTLPEGYRPPAKIQQFNAADGSAQASFLTTIDTNGKVNFVGKTQGFFTTATEYYIHCTFFVD